MCLSAEDRLLLEAAEACGKGLPDGFSKCAQVLRRFFDSQGKRSDAAEYAICNSGYEEPRVGNLYDRIRTMAARGLLEGRGDLILPAGPRYTECRITAMGIRQLRNSAQ
jgi:hypothetical protein